MAFTRRTFTGAANGAASTTIAAGPYSQSAGDLICVLVKWEGGNFTISSVTDTAGNTYVTTLQRARFAANDEQTQICYCLNATANASNTVTVTFSGSATFREINVQPYQPGGTVSFVAEPTPTTGTGTAAATGSFTAGTLAVSAMAEFSGINAAPGTNWTEQVDDVGTGAHFFDRIDNPGGTIVADATMSSSVDWLAAAASFTDVAQSPHYLAKDTRKFGPGISPDKLMQFRPQRFAAPDNIIGVLAGTATITFGQSGTLTPLAGQGKSYLPGPGPHPDYARMFMPRPLSQQSASVGALAGTATITFGQSGTAVGAGALAGSTTLTFGQSGAINGTGALSGSTSITFGQSGSIAGAGALAGTSTIVFGQSGTLTQPGAISGTATITFSQSGTIAGAGALSGTVSISFSATLQNGAYTAATVPVFATRRGMFGGVLYEDGDRLYITTPYQFSPYWMELSDSQIDQPPANWLPLMRTFSETVDNDVLRPATDDEVTTWVRTGVEP